MTTLPPSASKPADESLRTRLVVGLGASAGGLDAFKAFFAQMPADSGIAFVLVQHLDPDRGSSLVPIVSGYTAMPVVQAETGAEIEPDHVYVIPPNAILRVKGGVLQLESPAAPAARRVSISTFLTSLAEDQGEDAVGVILSGYGSDGAAGMEAIKEHGGLTLSQAEFDHHAKSGMPQSAASSGFVDHVMAVEEMAAALLNYQRHRTVFDAGKGQDGIREDISSQLATICTVLHGRLGRDFSQYKSGTLMRRIQRRMHVLQTGEVETYIAQLRTSPNEAELLFRELLISVTRFFRDPEAFEALDAKIVQALASDPRPVDPIRIWVPGCATGEEAYSVAILMKEALARAGRRRAVQIFATDVDDRAIDAARAGLYPGAIAADVSEVRLEQNFVKEDGSYRVTKDLREMCLFSSHDLVKDPPFSKLDLITCRNLMIYFEPQLQQRVLTTFHYALRPTGHLFIGPSESVSAQSRLFQAVDKRHRLYSRKDAAAIFPVLSFSREPAEPAAIRRSPPPPPNDEIERRAARAIAPYAPAYLVVDRNHEVLRFSGQTAKFLEPNGVASLNLFNLLHTDLRAIARAALKHAAATGGTALQEAVTFKTEEQYETLNLIVEPLTHPDQGTLFVVAFQQTGRGALQNEAGAFADSDEEGDNAILRRDLIATRERLRSVSEELEAANEELQSSNEEYLSINEELQSTNEELETSKEELQSLNEELQTINAELGNRNDSLLRSNSDLSNLFDSTSIATLFLDNDLHIRRFTPRLLEIFNVREGDEGRPISDIVTRLTRDGLADNVRQVLRTLTPMEREVAVKDGASYLMQVRPYLGLNNVMDGAVVTFVDISERKANEQARSRLAAIVEWSQDAIVSHDLDGTITSWNAGAERLYGYPSDEAVGRSLSELLDGALPEDWPQLMERLKSGELISQFEGVKVSKAGRAIDVSLSISPLREADGRIVGASVLARDISERRAADARAALLLGELDHRVKNILQIVSAVVQQTLRGTPEPKAFAAEIEGRIQAIASAQSLLTEGGQGAMALGALVEAELAPYRRAAGDGSQGPMVPGPAIFGPEVALTPKAGLSLALAVHELASNAAKYGALSVSNGRLTVSWTVEDGADGPVLSFSWTEAGGPPVKPPTRRGFGTLLIERTLTHDLDARVTREFPPEGVRCTFAIPLSPSVGELRPG